MGFREGDSSLIISRNVRKESIQHGWRRRKKRYFPPPPAPPSTTSKSTESSFPGFFLPHFKGSWEQGSVHDNCARTFFRQRGDGPSCCWTHIVVTSTDTAAVESFVRSDDTITTDFLPQNKSAAPLISTSNKRKQRHSDDSENIAESDKMNLRCLKLCRVYLDPFNLLNVGAFSGSWILKNFIQLQKEKGKFVVVYKRPP